MKFTIPKSYFDPAQPNIQEIINPRVKNILIMGCGAGALGLAIKQKQKTEIRGVESNTALANYAKSKLDNVIINSFDKSVSSLPDNYFNLIIFESMEHLSHPYSILKSINTKLIAGGEVIAQITNVLQWPVLKNLIEGDWKTHMSNEHKDACKKLIGQTLIDLGYEKDFQW